MDRDPILPFTQPADQPLSWRGAPRGAGASWGTTGSMRHFVSVHGGGEGATLPAAAEDILKQNALANLRAVRIESGFDYSGFEITGAVVPRDRRLDLPTAL